MRGPLASSGCSEPPDAGRPVGSDHAPVREQLTGVFEQDDAVTQQAPALLRMVGHDVRGPPIDGLRGRALRVVMAHGESFRCLGDCSTPSASRSGPLLRDGETTFTATYFLYLGPGGRSRRGPRSSVRRPGCPA